MFDRDDIINRFFLLWLFIILYLYINNQYKLYMNWKVFRSL